MKTELLERVKAEVAKLGTTQQNLVDAMVEHVLNSGMDLSTLSVAPSKPRGRKAGQTVAKAQEVEPEAQATAQEVTAS